MACPITLTGISLGCKDAIGGVSEFYVIDKSKVTPTPTVVNGVITVIPTGTDNFSTYKVKKQTASLVQTATIVEANDSIMYTNVLTVKINKLSTAARTELVQLVKGQLAIIVKLNSGVFLYLGMDNEVSVTGLVANSGTAFQDFNGYDLTFTDMSFDMVYEVSAGIIPALIA